MSVKVLQINYSLTAPRAAYEAENLSYAQPIADLPGLRWKIWIIDEMRGEAGGIYLFDSGKAMQSFLDGPIIAEMKSDPSLSLKPFDVIGELTAITRGPVKSVADRRKPAPDQ